VDRGQALIGRADTAGVARTYHLSPSRRLVNTLIRRLARWGIAGRHTYVLTVRGRTSGRLHSTPVMLVEDGERWLVAPYGAVAWVRNARAAGSVEIRRGRRSETLRVEEVPPERAAPVLRTHLTKVPVVRPFFDARPGSPLEAFVAEAPRHPVFRLTQAPPS
jgi:deazaflavin-dependent oxidoreductase (nitroreductase family)